jgi:protein associated with RNAse G/E
VTAATLRVEKRKFDGSLAAVDTARPLAFEEATVWHVAAGTERQRPRSNATERLDHDELWLAVPGEWWVLCAHVDASGTIDDLILHAAAPFEPVVGDQIAWVDLDLDFEVREGHVALEDEDEFHAHASSMAYPDEVVRGAWSGVSTVAARYTTGEWPFDGFLERCLP